MNAISGLPDIRRVAGLFVIVLLMLFGAATPSAAVQPDEILEDPKLEKRARKLSAQLRCVVCQNQSIDDSDAPLARDLRLLVRERLKAGESDDAVMSYIVARYGEFVLLRPTFGWHTLLLWFSPFLFLTGGIMLARLTIARAQGGRAASGVTHSTKPLSSDEQKRLQELLSNQNQDG
ncbi:MAG: cytochrome c-type biogenesis protein [Pseudomonadota bacterium]